MFIRKKRGSIAAIPKPLCFSPYILFNFPLSDIEIKF